MTATLLDQLVRHATDRPTDLAFRDATTGEALNWGDLHSRVAGVARHLVATVPPGGVVLIRLPNSVAFPVAFLGALAAGCGAFPVPTDLPPAEVQSLMGRAEVATVIDETPTALAHAQLPRVTMAGRLLLLSSGSTGQPKIVIRSAASLNAVCEQMCAAINVSPADRVLATVPLCHSYGVEHELLAPVWAGAQTHLCRGLDLPLVRWELRRSQITLLPGVPSTFEMLAALAERGDTYPSLRAAYSAGGALPASVIADVRDRCGFDVGQVYGATEIGSVTYAAPSAGPGVGQPMAGVRVRIGSSDGADHVWISAPSAFDGYVGGEPTGVVDGFYPTGDLGHVDANGNLHITGRGQLLIDVGGRKVNPIEVEAVLRAHPDVGDCVVVPVRQTPTVSRLHALVTPRRSGHRPDVDDLRRFARDRLPPYKVPRAFEVREALPRSATGKVLRGQVLP